MQKNDGSSISPALVFLDGNIAALDTKDSCLVIASYETLNDEKLVLTGLSTDGTRKLWELRQASLNADFLYSDNHGLYYAAEPATGSFFFNVGTEVIAIEMKSGKVLWRMKM